MGGCGCGWGCACARCGSECACVCACVCVYARVRVHVRVCVCEPLLGTRNNPIGRTKMNMSASLGSMPNPAGFSFLDVLCSCGCVSLRGLIVPQTVFAFSVLWRTRLVMVLWYGHVGCRCAVQVWVYGVCVRGVRFQCWIFGLDMVAEMGAHSGAGTNSRLRSESRYAIPMCSKIGRGPLKHHPVGFKDTGGGPIQYLPRCEL